MHDHHPTGLAQNSTNHQFGTGYGYRFGYSPFYEDCLPYDSQDIGQNFGCGRPTKARVR
jgi:hypothetical protein